MTVIRSYLQNHEKGRHFLIETGWQEVTAGLPWDDRTIMYQTGNRCLIEVFADGWYLCGVGFGTNLEEAVKNVNWEEGFEPLQ